jgi:alkylhydroperoxidase family enzyme
MVRVEYLDADDLDPDDRYLLSRPINLYRGLAHNVGALQHVQSVGAWIRWKSSVPSRTRELIILVIGQLSQSKYVYSHHVKYAYEFGASSQDIAAVADYVSGRPTNLSRPDVTALEAARELAVVGRVTSGTWLAIEECYSTSIAIEIAFVASFYIMVSKLAVSLEIEVEPEYEPYLEGFEEH